MTVQHADTSRFTITADDGTPLAGRQFEPDGSPEGVVLILPAMATPARFYAPLATWLAEQGFAVTTFDYRGYGASLTGHMRDVDADVVTWAGDAAAALDDTLEVSNGLPITVVGHSLGGQFLPWLDHSRIDQVVNVAAGVGAFAHADHTLANRLLSRTVMPLSIAVAGYFPGKRLGVFGDLPAGVMRQWVEWCRHEDYAAGAVPGLAQRYAEVTTPIASLEFTDDELITERAHAVLLRQHSSAPVSRHRWSPAELGVDRVGHHGFFRAGNEDLWKKALLPLLP